MKLLSQTLFAISTLASFASHAVSIHRYRFIEVKSFKEIGALPLKSETYDISLSKSKNDSASPGSKAAGKRELHAVFVTPGPKTKITTYYVQADKLRDDFQIEARSALKYLAEKCWDYASYQTLERTEPPDRCVRFAPFTSIEKLKPYKREATDRKMVLTKLGDQYHVGVQLFEWDGTELRRVLNSDSRLPERNSRDNRFADFMVGWALK